MDSTRLSVCFRHSSCGSPCASFDWWPGTTHCAFSVSTWMWKADDVIAYLKVHVRPNLHINLSIPEVVLKNRSTHKRWMKKTKTLIPYLVSLKYYVMFIKNLLTNPAWTDRLEGGSVWRFWIRSVDWTILADWRFLDKHPGLKGSTGVLITQSKAHSIENKSTVGQDFLPIFVSFLGAESGYLCNRSAERWVCPAGLLELFQKISKNKMFTL